MLLSPHVPWAPVYSFTACGRIRRESQERWTVQYKILFFYFSNLKFCLSYILFLCPPSNGYTVVGNEDVVSKFGVKPALLPDLFGLVGDAADNIPGEAKNKTKNKTKNAGRSSSSSSSSSISSSGGVRVGNTQRSKNREDAMKHYDTQQ